MRAKFDQGAYRPLIEVTLTMEGVSQQLWMMLDTGADTTTIDPDVAKALTGLDFDDLGVPGPGIRGMGDPDAPEIPSRIADAEIGYLGRTISMKLWVAPTPYPVLGRSDFMRRFHCCFYWDRQPPEFSVVAAPTGKAGPRPTNPTIKPKKKH